MENFKTVLLIGVLGGILIFGAGYLVGWLVETIEGSVQSTTFQRDLPGDEAQIIEVSESYGEPYTGGQKGLQYRVYEDGSYGIGYDNKNFRYTGCLNGGLCND